MGLHLGRNTKDRAGLVHWLVPAGIAIFSLLIAAGGEAAGEWLKYDRLAIQSGEVWRLLSGHFAHLGWPHLLLNLAGLALVWALVGARLSATFWLGVVLFSVTFISAAFWFLDENLIWYVGLSGLLHGLLVTGAVAGLRRSPGESIVIFVLVFGKVAYEQFAGPMPGSEIASGGPVVIDAHLYGAISGLIAGLPAWHRVRHNGAI